MKYAIINEQTKICINVVIWDGKSNWRPPAGTFLIQSDTISVGDTVIQVNGEWVAQPKIPIEQNGIETITQTQEE